MLSRQPYYLFITSSSGYEQKRRLLLRLLWNVSDIGIAVVRFALLGDVHDLRRFGFGLARFGNIVILARRLLSLFVNDQLERVSFGVPLLPSFPSLLFFVRQGVPLFFQNTIDLLLKYHQNERRRRW